MRSRLLILTALFVPVTGMSAIPRCVDLFCRAHIRGMHGDDEGLAEQATVQIMYRYKEQGVGNQVSTMQLCLRYVSIVLDEAGHTLTLLLKMHLAFIPRLYFHLRKT